MAEVKRDYREKTVYGFVSDGRSTSHCRVVVRMTSDKLGQSLSLQASNFMIGVAIESVKDIISVVTKEEKK